MQAFIIACAQGTPLQDMKLTRDAAPVYHTTASLASAANAVASYRNEPRTTPESVESTPSLGRLTQSIERDKLVSAGGQPHIVQICTPAGITSQLPCKVYTHSAIPCASLDAAVLDTGGHYQFTSSFAPLVSSLLLCRKNLTTEMSHTSSNTWEQHRMFP